MPGSKQATLAEQRPVSCELRRRMALVPQDPVIFGADAWENISW